MYLLLTVTDMLELVHCERGYRVTAISGAQFSERYYVIQSYRSGRPMMLDTSRPVKYYIYKKHCQIWADILLFCDVS